MNNHARIGHNGPPVFECAEDIEDVPNMYYVKFDIEALWKVLEQLPLDVGGLYMRMLLAMYRGMEALPGDDREALIRLGRVDIRTYRRVKEILLAHPHGLKVTPSGRISNSRFEQEVSAYVIEYRNRRDAAKAREERKRQAEGDGKIGGTEPEMSAKRSGNHLGDVGATLPNRPAERNEKTNNINGGHTTTLPEADQNQRHNYKLGTNSYHKEVVCLAPDEGSVAHHAGLPRLLDAEPAKKARKPREPRQRTTLDPLWRLSARLGEETLDTYAVDRETILREAMRFKTFWLDKGEAKADWDATWRKWCGSKFLNWPMRPGKASLLAEESFSRVEDAETVTVDPWAEQRAEAARRRAEEDGA